MYDRLGPSGWLGLYTVHALASTPFILLVQRIQGGWKAVPLR